MSCRVVVRAPHRHQRKGRLYHVSVDLKVPGHEIAVTRDPPQHHAHQDIYVAIRDAFDAAIRRLEDGVRRRRGDVKEHDDAPHGRIARIFPNEKYGFIDANNGDEIYFHANSVPNNGFERLKNGQEVRYHAEFGEKGLRATVVKRAGKHRMIP